ncbi:hypothetical protein ONS95_006810 [Cadophora gregata]|uniref:uncharacterized protein n=1 Tax=Cadophora gregata TaxID=51156 RepID=UPI0026DB30AB|nr:uncharacterized protein ONS95_006810 [Cadophora gregata]KAK0101650.1 hypothetical protein ONS95_006810 [Cadophora gregata]KAK0106334.1 hypothetical protein ONS96_003970 [Cadophora gregata f. sp. sojae]
MTCNILLLLLWTTAVLGLGWIGPYETISATATANWTPAPTKEAHKLIGRGVHPANLCGAQGPDYVLAYCGSKSYCAWFTDIKVVGCCSSGGASCDAVYTSCIDLRDDFPDGETVPGVFTCTNLCYKNSFPDGYYQYGCGSTSIGESVVYRWPGDNPDVSIDFLYTGDAFKENTATAVTIAADTASPEAPDIPTTSAKPTSSSKQTPTSQTTKDPPSTTIPAGGSTIPATGAGASFLNSPSASSTSIASSNITGAASTGQDGGLSTGAMIAIGVAAGVVAVVAILLLGFCCHRRRKKQTDSNHFLNTPADQLVAQYEQPAMGTRTNPTELYQGLPMKKEETQYHVLTTRESSPYARESGQTNSTAPSYELAPSNEPVRQASPQSIMSTGTFPSGSPYPTSTVPTPNMPQYPHMYELPTSRAARIPELDSSEAQGPGVHTSHGWG